MSPRDHHRRVTAGDGLGSEMDRFETAPADLVDGLASSSAGGESRFRSLAGSAAQRSAEETHHGRDGRRESGLDGGLSGSVLARSGLKDVAEYDLVDHFRLDARFVEHTWSKR